MRRIAAGFFGLPVKTALSRNVLPDTRAFSHNVQKPDTLVSAVNTEKREKTWEEVIAEINAKVDAARRNSSYDYFRAVNSGGGDKAAFLRSQMGNTWNR